jgi:hypothetical protein
VPHVRIWPGGDGQPSSLPGPLNAIERLLEAAKGEPSMKEVTTVEK